MKDSLETLSMVDRLRKELAKNQNYLRDQIRPLILDNPHKGNSLHNFFVWIHSEGDPNKFFWAGQGDPDEAFSASQGDPNKCF